MKEKIIFLIIGILIGAIVTTTGFLIYNKTVHRNPEQMKKIQMDVNSKGRELQSEVMKEPQEKMQESSKEDSKSKSNKNKEEAPIIKSNEESNEKS